MTLGARPDRRAPISPTLRASSAAERRAWVGLPGVSAQAGRAGSTPGKERTMPGRHRAAAAGTATRHAVLVAAGLGLALLAAAGCSGPWPTVRPGRRTVANEVARPPATPQHRGPHGGPERPAGRPRGLRATRCSGARRGRPRSTPRGTTGAATSGPRSTTTAGRSAGSRCWTRSRPPRPSVRPTWPRSTRPRPSTRRSAPAAPGCDPGSVGPRWQPMATQCSQRAVGRPRRCRPATPWSPTGGRTWR